MTDTGATTELRHRTRPHPPAIGAATLVRPVGPKARPSPRGDRYRAGMEGDIRPERTWTPPAPPDPASVRLVLVSECAATDPADDYGASDRSVFDETTLAAFAEAGLHADSIAELRGYGIHLTVAVRHPKTRDRISAATIAAGSPLLADELASLPEARAYLLMGDVAIAAINQIARRRTGRRAIPAGSTYRIRDGEYHLDGVRLFPSYLQAGPAWYIEASKRRMVAEDIAAALAVAGIAPSADRPLTRVTAARLRTPPRSR